MHFVNRKLQKVKYNRSKLRNKYKKQKKSRKSIKTYLNKVSQKGIKTNKDILKHFLTNKGTIPGNDVILINSRYIKWEI